ncbi:MAG: hypothetical protein VW475_03130 [Curvibacter sp.]
MDSINDTALLDVLQQLPALCPAFAGAVVATCDGLVMAAVGDYGGDMPAACAASLGVHLQDDLQPLAADAPTALPGEALIFGSDRLWYFSRLTAGHLLLLNSRQTVHAGAVRLAGQTTATRLNHWLHPAST